MARKDIEGFFWNDTPPPKPPPKEKPKRTPPERTWERPDYLPNLAEALVFNVDLLQDHELLPAVCRGERFVFDIECYPNYFLIAFQSVLTRKVMYFELAPGIPLLVDKLRWVMEHLCIVSFNGYNYDMPIASLAVAGKSNAQLFHATEEIILRNARPADVLRQYKAKALKSNHIDLIEVAPLRASLKIYSGRLHCPRMQDLPFVPGTVLSFEQAAIVRWYCCNDLNNTALLYHELEDQITLRETLGKEYGVDLRSRSDAQIAETVISHEVVKLNGARSKRPEIPPGTRFKYNMPSFVQYSSDAMRWVLEVVRNVDFVVSESGEVGMPPELKDLAIPIGGGLYRMGIGGLHSSEQKAAHFADENTVLIDRDVASYYPNIILNQGLFPQHLGVAFLHVYRQLVTRRLHAKHTGDKVTADSIKITINGGFGKFGSPYSILYSPHLLIQVTITGQLCLLMLIERLEAIGIPVVSANTDGIIIKCPKARQSDLDAVIQGWEKDTSFKAKGAYCERGSAGNSVLSKNPSALICSDAVLTYLTTGRPVIETIRDCRNVARFVVVRSVTGGAVKDGVYLGKSIRWYYSVGEGGEIIYAKNGNKVPRTDNAKPLMDLPGVFPEDIDYNWYEQEAYSMLADLSCPGFQKVVAVEPESETIES